MNGFEIATGFQGLLSPLRSTTAMYRPGSGGQFDFQDDLVVFPIVRDPPFCGVMKSRWEQKENVER
jgi:hypothetical protein